MLTWLLVTFGVSLGSAVFPLLSIEVFIVALAARHPGMPVVLFGLVIAIGQVAGKLVYFYAARGSLRLPKFVHRKANIGAVRTVAIPVHAGAPGFADSGPPFGDDARPAVATGVDPGPPRRLPAWWHTFAAWVARGWSWLREKCHRHPRWMVAATASSALLGVPPFLPTTVLAGLAGLPLRAYVAASLPARWIRFSMLAASPMFVRHWMHILPFLHHHLH